MRGQTLSDAVCPKTLRSKIESELFKNLQEEFQHFAKIFTGKIAELRQKIRENELEASDIRAAFKLNRFQKQDEINSFRNELITRNKERLFNEIRKIKSENCDAIVHLEKRLSELVLRERHLAEEVEAERTERLRLEHMHLKPPEKLGDVLLMKQSHEMEVQLAEEEEELEMNRMAAELRALETKRMKAEREFQVRFARSPDDHSNIVPKDTEGRFRSTFSVLNSEVLDSRPNGRSGAPSLEAESKLNYLLHKEETLRQENQELNAKLQHCIQELEKRKQEFEKVMQQMAADFSAKKRPRHSEMGSVGFPEDNEQRRARTAAQQRMIQVLTEHLLKLESVRSARNHGPLAELWNEVGAQIDQMSRQPHHQMSPKPSSQANVICGSEMFEDFEFKTSIDGSSRKPHVRTIRSQSPGKHPGMGVPLSHPPSNFESLDEGGSFNFGLHSQFTEQQFSAQKQSPAVGRVIRLN